MKIKPKRYRRLDAPFEVSCDSHDYSITKNNFWAKPDDLLRLIMESEIESIWNFQSALGDTLIEKHESFYIRLDEISNLLLRKVAGCLWIATNSKNAYFESLSLEHQFYNVDEVKNIGTIYNRWQLFICDKIPNNILLIGLDNHEHEKNAYATLKIEWI